MAVLVEALRVEVINPLAVTQSCEDGWLLALSVGRNQPQDGLTDHLIGRVSEDPLRGLVPTRHNPVQVFGDNRVIRRINDSRQEMLRTVKANGKICRRSHYSAPCDNASLVVNTSCLPRQPDLFSFL